MRNPNKPILEIDERPKGREGIVEMLDRMFSTDEDGNPENKKEEKNKIAV